MLSFDKQYEEVGLTVAINARETVTETHRAVTLGEVIDAWLSRSGISPKMRQREAWSARFALDHFGADRVASTITSGELREWASELARSSLAPVSVQVTLRTVARAFQDASDRGLLRRNPARDGLPRGLATSLREAADEHRG